MEKKKVGNSDIHITKLGFGTAFLGRGSQLTNIENELSTINKAYQLGINYFDTAPRYGSGKCEKMLSICLRNKPRKHYIISTKVGYYIYAKDGPKDNPSFGNSDLLLSYDNIMKSFEQSLKSLKVDYIDILFLHDPDDQFDIVMSSGYSALHKLREAGYVKAIGVGTTQSEILCRLASEAEFDCFLLSGRYTLLDQSALITLLPLCKEKNISVILGSIYNSGILVKNKNFKARYNYEEASQGILNRVNKMEIIADSYQVPLSAAALQFPLAHPSIISVVMGTRYKERVKSNYDKMSLKIPKDFWNELKHEQLISAGCPIPNCN